MEYKNSNEKEVIIDIESGETNHGAEMKNDPNSANKWGKKSLNKLVSGVLGLNGPTNIESDVNTGAYSHETTGLLVDNTQGGNLLSLIDQDNEKERRKAKKASKPPRPPKGPSLDAADMRLIKEISKIAMQKRERIERMKALKKMKAARMASSSSGGTISAMIFTVLFFLVIIFQGLGCSSSSKATGAPQPAPETTDLTPLQFYESVLSDAPGYQPPKSMRHLSGSEFTSLG